MDFGEVLTKAWKIVWKYKILWLFGIFASCSGGGGGGGGGGGSGVQYTSDMPPGAYYTINHIDPWVWALIVAGLVLLGLLITAIILTVSTIGRIGLIQGTAQADADENAKLTFSGLFNSLKPYFWRVLGLNLLLGLGIFVALVILIFGGIFGTIFTLGLLLICLIPLCCLLIPILWILATFIEMANVAVVVEDLSVVDGIKRGWQVFKDNLGNLILLSLVLVVGGFIVGMIVALPMIMLMIPLMMGVFAAVFGNSGALATSSLIISGLCFVAYLPVLLVISGIIRAYISSAWTLTFLRLTKGPAAVQPVEIFPDEPVEPAALPEAVAEPASEAETEVAPEPEKPANPDDLLPQDF